jgi:uncharacterized membrane protein (DUF106 family)
LYGSAFFYALVVFFVSFFMSLASILLRLRFVNPEDSARWQEEMKRWNADRERAKKTNDKKLIAQLKKQEKLMTQIQSRMLKGQTISLFATIILFLSVWSVLGSYVAGQQVAYTPFFIPFISMTGAPPYEMPFYAWYFVCSTLSGIMLQRIFRLSFATGLPQTAR